MSIIEDFDKFLGDRYGEGGALERATIPDEIALLDYEGMLKEAGLDEDKAYELQGTFLHALSVSEEAAYSQGVKDGFRLAMHLLGMAPESRKEASQ